MTPRDTPTSTSPTTLPSGVRIAPAIPADVETLVALYEEAARWLVARGIQQWQPGALTAPMVAAEVARGGVYLARVSGAPAASITLLTADSRIWGIRPDDALYAHGLSVSRAFAGRQLGRAILRWAAGQVAARGKTYLRLDCVAHNPRLRAYYEDAGFQHQGDIGAPPRATSLYQKRVYP